MSNIIEDQNSLKFFIWLKNIIRDIIKTKNLFNPNFLLLSIFFPQPSNFDGKKTW
jgi:hypothetical protein